MADLDGDGFVDLLSGSWPGEIFWFKGGPGRSFAAPEMLKDKDGKYINIGGGVSRDFDGGITVTGNADFETTPEGTVIKYHDQVIKVPEGVDAGITGTASAVHAFDWDGDGDLDLFIGDIGGSVHYLRNDGTPKAFAFAKEAALSVEGAEKSGLIETLAGVFDRRRRTGVVRVEGDAGPFVADWDADGRPDLLVGSGDGSVWWYRNIGTRAAPRLAKGELLVPPGESNYANPPKEPVRGVRSKVCAADWNGDGRLDLLVGDAADQKPDLPEPTEEQRAEHVKLRAELDKLQGRYGSFIDKLHGPSKVKDPEERKKVTEEFSSLLAEMREIREKLPRESEPHGWVWLFLRKPAAGESSKR